MNEPDFHKYVVILLAIIALALVVFVITIIYVAVTVQPVQQKINNILDNVDNTTEHLNNGLSNIQKDVANIKTKGNNFLQNLVSEAKTAMPSVFNWFEKTQFGNVPVPIPLNS